MIYFDNAATTKPDEEAVQRAMPFLQEEYGNPSAHYSFGRKAKVAIEHARKQVANVLCVNPREVYFTSGSTEAANYIMRCGYKSNVVYMSTIEHHAYLRSAGAYCDLIDIPVNELGEYCLDEVDFDNDGMICLSIGNNVIGTVLDIDKLKALRSCVDLPIVLDITQAFGHIPIEEYVSCADIVFGSFHKMGGIKGSGFIYISDRIKPQLSNIAYGGEQEQGFRASTENVFGIVIGGHASEIAQRNLLFNKNIVDCTESLFVNKLTSCFGDKISFNSLNDSRSLPGIINVEFKGYRAEEILTWLDQFGVCASSGSACDSESNEPNYVLKAIGLTDAQANSSLRFSLSHNNTEEEVDKVVEILNEALDVLAHD